MQQAIGEIAILGVFICSKPLGNYRGSLICKRFCCKLLGKSNFWASSLAASSFETIAEAPFPGFLFCSNLLGKSHFGASSFVSSSSESCICSVFLSSNLLGNYWDSIFFAAIHWGIPTCELFFCSKLLGKSNFLAFCCFKVLGISTCKASSASKLVGNSELPSFCAKLFEDFDCKVLFCFKLLRGYGSDHIS